MNRTTLMTALVLLSLAWATAVSAEEWTIAVTPSGTQGGYIETADGQSQSSVQYSTTWPAQGYLPVLYVHFPVGTFAVTSKNDAAVRVNVREVATGSDVLLSQRATSFSLTTEREGWFRLQLTGGTPGATVLQDFTVTSGNATGQNSNVYLAGWRSAPSLHLWTFGSSNADLPDGNAFDWIYDEVMIPEDADFVGTYAEAFGFSGGYIGIQNNGTNGGTTARTIIFSSWDNGDTDSDPDLADFKRSGVIATGQADQITAERFGGEGTGCHIMLNGNLWKAGQWVRFLLNTRPEQITLSDGTTYNNTLLSAWYWAEGIDTDWHYIGTMRQAGTTNYFGTGFNAFLEEYTRGNSSQGCAEHKAYYRRVFTRSMEGGAWYNRNQFAWGHTDGGTADGARNDRYQTALDDFLGEPAIYMQTGGYGETYEGPSVLAYVKPDDIVPDDATLLRLIEEHVEPAIQKQDEDRMAQALLADCEQIAQTEWTVTDFSSEETVGEGSNGRAAWAVDGDASTYWHTSWWSSGNLGYPHHLALLHDGAVRIDKMVINNPRGSNYRAKTVQVLTSDDGTTWTSAGTFSLPDAEVQEVALEPALNTSRVKLNFTEGYGQYVVVSELCFYQKNLDKLREHAKDLLDHADEFNYYPTEHLTALQAVYDNAASTVEDFEAALTSLAQNGTLLKYGEVTEIGHLSAEKAYYLFSASGYGAMTTEGDELTLRNASPAEGSGHYSDCQAIYKTKARVQDEASNWMILASDQFPGYYYIYNMAAGKYLNPQYHSDLSDTPQPFSIEKKSGGFVLSALQYQYDNRHTQICLAPQFTSGPVSVWNNDEGNYFIIYDNYSLKPSAGLIAQLRHDVLWTMKGDVNSDGLVNIADVTALVKILLGTYNDTYRLRSADVNDDGSITIADVTALVNEILRK